MSHPLSSFSVLHSPQIHKFSPVKCFITPITTPSSELFQLTALQITLKVQLDLQNQPSTTDVGIPLYIRIPVPSDTQLHTVNSTVSSLFSYCDQSFPSTKRKSCNSFESDEESDEETQNQNNSKIVQNTVTQSQCQTQSNQSDQKIQSDWKISLNQSNDSTSIFIETTLHHPLPTELTFNLLYSHSLITPHYLSLPIIATNDSNATNNPPNKWFDFIIYSNCITRADAGKNCEETLSNMKHRHASGSFVSIVEPKIDAMSSVQKVKSVLEKAVIRNSSSGSSGIVFPVSCALRLRKIMGPHTDHPLQFELKRKRQQNETELNIQPTLSSNNAKLNN